MSSKKEKFNNEYQVAKTNAVNALIDKMVDQKLAILKAFLKESGIEYDDSIKDYKKLVKYLKKNLKGEVRNKVVKRCKEIDESVENTIDELSKGSTTAFSRFADIAKGLIKPVTIGLALNTAIRLAPNNITRLAIFGVSVLYNGYTLIKNSIQAKKDFSEENLNKYLFNLELKFTGDKLTDTRFSLDEQNIIRDYFAKNDIEYVDTGYQSLRAVLYKLTFDQKFELVCKLTGRDTDSAQKKFRKDLGIYTKVEKIDEDKNRLIAFLKNKGDIGVNALLASSMPWLASSLNGMIANGVVSGQLGSTVGKATGFLAFITSYLNQNSLVMGVESFLILSVLGNIGKGIKKLFDNLKEKKNQTKLIEEYQNIEKAKYADDDLNENKKLLEMYDNSAINGKNQIVVEIITEYLKYVGVKEEIIPKNVDELSKFLKSDKITARQKRKVRSFLKELSYFNTHKNNKFVRKLEKILKASGTIAALGLAGMSIYDFISGGKFLNDIFQKLYYESNTFASISLENVKYTEEKPEGVLAYKIEKDGKILWRSGKPTVEFKNIDLFNELNGQIYDVAGNNEAVMALVNKYDDASLENLQSIYYLMQNEEGFAKTYNAYEEAYKTIIELRAKEALITRNQGLVSAGIAIIAGEVAEMKKKKK